MRREHYNAQYFFFSKLLVHTRASHFRTCRVTTNQPKLSFEFLKKHVLESFAVFSKLLNAFVELVESHLVLKELPAEFGLIVDERNFLNAINLCGGLWAKFPRDRIRAVPQLLEESGRDGKEVHACECFDFANLQEIRRRSVRNA
jgi:hypothetical protein